MECLIDLFSIEELANLDEKQIEILHQAILRELRTSPQIRQILREKFRPEYDQLTRGRTQRGRASRTPRTPPASDPSASE
jgi:hypothetical protein